MEGDIYTLAPLEIFEFLASSRNQTQTQWLAEIIQRLLNFPTMERWICRSDSYYTRLVHLVHLLIAFYCVTLTWKHTVAVSRSRCPVAKRSRCGHAIRHASPCFAQALQNAARCRGCPVPGSSRPVRPCRSVLCPSWSAGGSWWRWSNEDLMFLQNGGMIIMI